MKSIIFNIISQKLIPIDLLLEDQRKFPIHEHYLVEVQNRVVIYKYKAEKTLDEKKYIAFLKKELKKKYKAYSITVGTLQEQLQK